MSLPTPQQLAETILQHELLEGEARQLLRAEAARFQDARDLASELLRRDWLTAYQINQLFLGRGKDLVLGPYVFLERLGEGGMGQVFKAWQKGLRRVVALKVIRKDFLNNEKVIKRFQREMQAAGRLSHPHIVHAYDADEVGGVCFIAMEYIDGIDLARLVKQSGPLPAAQACDYIRQAALGLQHAHEQGLVHRDVKPANLVLTRQGGKSSLSLPRPGAPSPVPAAQREEAYPWGVVKILDLGLARWTDPDNGRTHLTQIGSVMGTPDFIAPEQARNSSTCDIRADIYSLGCTLYYLLAAQPPFPSGTLTEKLLNHQMDHAEPVEQARRKRLLEADWVAAHGKPARDAVNIPAEVLAILRKLMAKKPEDRFQTPGDVAQHLSRFLKGLARHRKTRPMPRPDAAAARPAAGKAGEASPPQAEARPAAPQSEATTPRPRQRDSQRRPAAARSRHNARRRVALATLAIALVSGMLLAAMNGQNDRPEAAAPAPEPRVLTPVEAQLLTLRQKVKAPEDVRALRHEIVRFRAAHAGSALAREASGLLALLPSPLDHLDRGRIDKPQKFDWQPTEVVAILGNWKGSLDGKPFTTLAFSPDGGHLLAGGDETVLRAWNCEAILPPLKLFGPAARVSRLAVSPDGRHFATAAGDGFTRIWDASTRMPKITLERHSRPVLAVAYHPAGGKLASSCADGKIRLLDILAGKELFACDAHTDAATCLLFSPEGRFLFWSGRTRDVHWVDLMDPKNSGRLPHRQSAITALAFHPGGECLLGASANGAVIAWKWDGKNLAEAEVVKDHARPVLDLAVAPDGERFVSVGADHCVKLWNLASFKPEKSWELRWPILAVAFAPDGRHFATANGNTTIYIFRTTTR